MKNVWLLAIIIATGFFLSWCTSVRGETQSITITPWITLAIPASRTSIPSSLMENRQITNAIVAAYRIPNDENTPTTMQKNFLISKSRLKLDADLDNYRIIQSRRLKYFLPWYTLESQQAISFTCATTKIPWIYVEYTVKDTSVAPIQTYYFAQYMMTLDGHWYVLSYVSDNKRDRSRQKSFLTKPTCQKP
jgi:hypothetical protein